jgi:hypothetical protein
MILLYDRPIVWYENNQLTGDSIVVELREEGRRNRIEKMFIYRRAFLHQKIRLIIRAKNSIKFQATTW